MLQESTTLEVGGSKVIYEALRNVFSPQYLDNRFVCHGSKSGLHFQYCYVSLFELRVVISKNVIHQNNIIRAYEESKAPLTIVEWDPLQAENQDLMEGAYYH